MIEFFLSQFSMDFFPISCSLLPLQRRSLQEQSVHFTSELVSTCLRFNNSDRSVSLLSLIRFQIGLLKYVRKRYFFVFSWEVK